LRHGACAAIAYLPWNEFVFTVNQGRLTAFYPQDKSTSEPEIAENSSNSGLFVSRFYGIIGLYLS
jgi:hypothetical protein